MIGTVFKFGTEVVEVRVDNKEVSFRNSRYGSHFVPIEGIQLIKSGVIKEHPDLKGKADWKQQAIERFKSKVGMLKTEERRMNYIVEDLMKFGYTPYAQQKNGFRTKKL